MVMIIISHQKTVNVKTYPHSINGIVTPVSVWPDCCNIEYQSSHRFTLVTKVFNYGSWKNHHTAQKNKQTCIGTKAQAIARSLIGNDEKLVCRTAEG